MQFSPRMLTFRNVLYCMIESAQEFVDLDFSETSISDVPMIRIVKLYHKSLMSLRLDSCKGLTARAYKAIGECSKLRHLSLYDTLQINDDNLECIITKTADLEQLNLGHCGEISSRSIRLLVELKKLQHLNLNSCKNICINSFSSLKALTALQLLSLGQTDLNIDVLRQLALLRDLRSLELQACVKLGSEAFKIICNKFTRLETLNLEATITSGEGEGCQFQRSRNLRVLNTSYAARIPQASFGVGIGSTGLKSLSVRKCYEWLDDETLRNIANHHVGLEHLNLADCGLITDDSVVFALRCLPRLNSIQFRVSFIDGTASYTA